MAHAYVSQVPLTLRRQPTQARSRETFEQILAVSAQLLAEVGFEAFTTNLLAKRSGIGTRAIYRYFPNKFALVAELARRMSDRWNEELAVLEFESEGLPWPDLWSAYLTQYVAAVRATPGGPAVLVALQHPELRTIDDELNVHYVREITASLRAAQPGLPASVGRLLSEVMLKSTVVIVDASLAESPDEAEEMLAMLQLMHRALLEQYLPAN